VAGALSEALPANGRLAGAAFRLATETGARAADVFADLAVRATEAGDLARERRALTAQARLSAALVGGAPIAVVALLVVSGRASALLESSSGRAIGAIGLALLVAGGLVVWVMVRTAER
jgi:Flp pilus assembly protein TadB